MMSEESRLRKKGDRGKGLKMKKMIGEQNSYPKPRYNTLFSTDEHGINARRIFDVDLFPSAYCSILLVFALLLSDSRSAIELQNRKHLHSFRSVANFAQFVSLAMA